MKQTKLKSMFTHVRDYIIMDCFQSTFITDNAPAVLSHCVRSACDDRGCDDAKHITLDDTRRELSHRSTVLQHPDALANTGLGILSGKPICLIPMMFICLGFGEGIVKKHLLQ